MRSYVLTAVKFPGSAFNLLHLGHGGLERCWLPHHRFWVASLALFRCYLSWDQVTADLWSTPASPAFRCPQPWRLMSCDSVERFTQALNMASLSSVQQQDISTNAGQIAEQMLCTFWFKCVPLFSEFLAFWKSYCGQYGPFASFTVGFGSAFPSKFFKSPQSVHFGQYINKQYIKLGTASPLRPTVQKKWSKSIWNTRR